MLYYLIVAITLRLTNAEKYFQIEDIPIENFSFERDDLQNDAVDIELMPRFQRSFPTSSEDPKEYFFNRPLYEDNNFDTARDVPRPGGFDTYSEEYHGGAGVRNKREAMQPSAVKLDGKEVKSIVKRLGKPLELVIIDPEKMTEQEDEDVNTDLPVTDEGITEASNFLINDFIRFKREAAPDRGDDVARIKDMMKKIEDENKNKPNSTEINPKSMVEEVPTPYTEKLVMDRRDEDKEPMRETRGATKDQWVKQEYPVRRNDLEDNSASSDERDHVRAPRVHFVTQGMSESALRPEYNRYDREARSRHLNKEVAWNLARDPYRDLDYYQPRYTRNFIPPSYPNFRQDRYLNYDSRDPWDDRDRPRSRYYEYPERAYNDNYNNYSGKRGRQRRIIYYASLPEVTRPPPNADLRDRFDYRERDRYDDRVFYPNPGYQLRRPYDKARFEENENRKPQQPLKVSTDVSVRDVKKNPERRIYSEVADRNRYPQNSQYQNERLK